MVDLAAARKTADADTEAPLKVIGWEEWDRDADGKVAASRGWYDAADYSRQAGA